jgi:hypothetical protein
MIEAASFPQNLIKAREQVVWFRPRGTAWGVTPDINAAVNRLKLAWRNATREEGSIPMILLDVHRTPNDTLRTFRPVFDRCVSMWSQSALRSLDVLVIGRLAAVLTVRLDLGNRASVAIGYASTDQETLCRLEKALGLEDKLKTGFVLWPPQASG